MIYRTVLALLLIAASAAAGAQGNEDPLEFINRPLFVVNDVLDRGVMRPVAQGYDRIVPQPAKTGVANFFANLLEVTNTVNALLQGRLDGAGRHASRLAVNSTIGILGLFDVATDMGIARERTDFGQTLATWGVPEGPYLMVPLLGPRTLRHGAGTFVDIIYSPTFYVDDVSVRNTLFFTELVSFRAQALKADQLMSGDRYIFLRDAYLQQRRALVSGGKVQDDFSDYEDDWAEEF
jgi:phospholipid-binding lipoprotein MlaA